MAEEKGKWGGSRSGAGRPRVAGKSGELRAALGVALPPDLIAVLVDRASRESCSRSEALVRIVREWAAARRADGA